MKVLESSIDRGSVYAQVNISAADIAAAGSTQGAVKAAIDAFTAENGLPALIYVRVTAMDECGDGGIDVRFEGAIAPDVILGQYKGVEVDVGHCEDFVFAIGSDF